LLIDVWSPMKVIRGDRALWLAVLGNTYFFFVGGLLQFNIFIMVRMYFTSVRRRAASFKRRSPSDRLGQFAAGYPRGGKSSMD